MEDLRLALPPPPARGNTFISLEDSFPRILPNAFFFSHFVLFFCPEFFLPSCLNDLLPGVDALPR